MHRMRPVALAVALCATAAHLLLHCSEDDGATDAPSAGTTIGVAGGTYDLGSGITLEVPPGAVTSDVEGVSVALVDSSYADSILATSGLTTRRLLAAFTCRPIGVVFGTAATITLPAAIVDTGLPYHYELDTTNETFIPVEGSDVTYDPVAGTVTVLLRYFSTHAAVKVTQDSSTLLKRAQPADCRDQRVRVQEGSRDYMDSRTNCQIVRVAGSATYFDCAGSPTETWQFEEVAKGCVPSLSLDLPREVEVGGTATGTATVKLGAEPQEAVDVIFRLNQLGTVSPRLVPTDATGQAPATVTAGQDEGTANLRATAIVTYYLSYTRMYAGGMSEERRGPERTKVVGDNKDIDIYAKPRLTMSASRTTLQPNQTSTVSLAVEFRGGQLGGVDLSLSASPASGGDLNASSVTTGPSGATVTFIAGDERGTVTIRATGTARYQLPSGTWQSEPLDQSVSIFVDAPVPEQWSGTMTMVLSNCDHPTSACVSGSVEIQFSFVHDPLANNFHDTGTASFTSTLQAHNGDVFVPAGSDCPEQEVLQSVVFGSGPIPLYVLVLANGGDTTMCLDFADLLEPTVYLMQGVFNWSDCDGVISEEDVGIPFYWCLDTNFSVSGGCSTMYSRYVSVPVHNGSGSQNGTLGMNSSGGWMTIDPNGTYTATLRRTSP